MKDSDKGSFEKLNDHYNTIKNAFRNSQIENVDCTLWQSTFSKKYTSESARDLHNNTVGSIHTNNAKDREIIKKTMNALSDSRNLNDSDPLNAAYSQNIYQQCLLKSLKKNNLSGHSY